jgi:hypothetical protein
LRQQLRQPLPVWTALVQPLVGENDGHGYDWKPA